MKSRHACTILLLMSIPAMSIVAAETIRFATFNTSLNRNTAGALQEELAGGNSGQAHKIAEILQRVRPDVVLLNEVDYDSSGKTLLVFCAADRLGFDRLTGLIDYTDGRPKASIEVRAVDSRTTTEPFCAPHTGDGHATSRSHHLNLVQVLLVDGSVQRIHDSIDLITWRAYGTIGGDHYGILGDH